MVMPTLPIIAPPIAQFLGSDERLRDPHIIVIRNASIANLLERCALTIPCHEPGEAPVGFMLMGERMADKRLLAIGGLGGKCPEPERLMAALAGIATGFDMQLDDAAARVQVIIDADRQDLIDLCLQLGNARDYAGEELDVGKIVVRWLSDAGIEAFMQFISETSVNAVGVLRGSGDRDGGGRSLILNAHMDTQGSTPSGGEEVERRLRGAWAKDDLLYGGALANDQGPACRPADRNPGASRR